VYIHNGILNEEVSRVANGQPKEVNFILKNKILYKKKLNINYLYLNLNYDYFCLIIIYFIFFISNNFFKKKAKKP
jgi:hypothetical protein